MVILGGGFLLTVVAVAAWYFKPLSQQDIKAQLRAKVEQQQTEQEQQADDKLIASQSANSEAQAAIKQATDELEKTQETNLDELLAQPWDDDRQIKSEHQFDSPEDKNAEESKVIEVINLDSVGQKIDQTVNLDGNVDATSQALAQHTAQTSQKVAKQQAVNQSANIESINKLMDNEWFLTQAATGAMVQLAGLSEKRVLDGYLQRHQLQSSARIYQSVRNGKPWYVVTLGPYANMNDARKAIGQLSQKLQDTRPWAKSIKAIQSEIINANK